MPQPTKKTPYVASSQAKAKPASASASAASSASARAAQSPFSAAQAAFANATSTHHSAESAVKFGTEAVREFVASGSEEAKKAQEKMFAMTREGAEHVSRTAEAASKTLNDTINAGRDNVEAALECASTLANMAQAFSAECCSYANAAFSTNVELSKDVFACRTMNDWFDLQSRMTKANLDQFFNQSARFSEMAFQYASEVTEPLNERVAEATERFTKAMAA